MVLLALSQSAGTCQDEPPVKNISVELPGDKEVEGESEAEGDIEALIEREIEVDGLIEDDELELILEDGEREDEILVEIE
jgi:hypothetical protein